MSRRPARLPALLSTPGPTVAVALAVDGVTAVQLAWSRNRPTITAHARVGLPAGALAPGVAAPNVVDAKAVTDALGQVLGRLPRRPSRVALVVPDSAAKVSLVRFDKVPSRTADLEQLIRWQMRKAAPFRLEEAQIAYTPGAAVEGGGREFVIVLMRRDVVEEYERVCMAAGAHPGLIDLASFNVINVALAATNGAKAADWLLVHVAAGYSTLAIVRGGELIFFRTRPWDGSGNLADLVHQTAMYYQDRLGGAGFGRALLAGEPQLVATGGGPGAVRQALEERLDTGLESIATVMRAPVEDTTGADPALLDALAAPVGLLVRDRLVAGA